MRRPFQQLLIRPNDLSPSADDLDLVGAFNPGVAQTEDGVVLLVRIAERPRARRAGMTALPYWVDGRVVVDWVRDDEWEWLDARVVRRCRDGLLRLTSTSHVRVIRSRDGRSIEHEGVRLLPETESEEFGIEDPRVTPIDGRFYITYVCVSRHGAATALASTDDFETFERAQCSWIWLMFRKLWWIRAAIVRHADPPLLPQRTTSKNLVCPVATQFAA